MTDLSRVMESVRALFLSEQTVGTDAATTALAAVKAATVSIDDADQVTAKWLSEEHAAGSLLIAAAIMNKRSEASGTGDPFDRLSRSVIINRFNSWASEFAHRLELVQSGQASPRRYLPGLWRFRADPINNEP